MALPYDPRNWYWAVAAAPGQLYSSAAVAYVPSNDPAFLAWYAAGGAVTPIATESDLWDVLSAAGVAIPATAAPSDTGRDDQVNKIDRVTMQVLFNHENRIRALEGRPSITRAQFRTAIKSLL